MKKQKSTKSALLASGLALLMCMTMLVGSTFAWFTDSVTSAGNKIQSGTLDIVLEYSEDDGTTWKDAENQVLKFKAADNREEILWEPGCTYELPLIRVRNNGNLALQYSIVISGVEGDAKLLEAIDFTTKVGDAEATSLYNFEGVLNKNGDVSDKILITGHMREDAGNEYQDLTADGIAITVFATQQTYEKDSFDEKYDANSAVNTIAEAEALMAANEPVVLLGCNDPNGVLNIPAAYTETLTLANVNIKSVQAEKDANIEILGNVVINAKGTASGVALMAEEAEAFDGSAISAQGKLNIYGDGKLTAIAADVAGAAGIGGMKVTDITIKDVTIVNAMGSFAYGVGTDTKYYKDAPEGGAAIGSAYDGANITLDNVKVVKAIGGSKAAGIGARYHTGVNVTIKDSNIIYAEGGVSAAGIGGSRVSNGAAESGTTITISNSTVTAKGGAYGAGIGSGYDTHCQKTQPLCTINISDSTINAEGGKYAAGIGTGYHNAALAGEIKNSTVNAVSGEKFYKDTYTQAQDIGFGVVDPAREGIQTNSYIIYNGINTTIPEVIKTVDNVTDLDNALQSGQNVALKEDLKVDSTQTTANSGYGATGVAVNGSIFDGNNNVLSVENANNTWDCALCVSGGTVKNLTIDSGFRGILIQSATSTVYLDNVHVQGAGVGYALNTGEGDSTQELVVTNSSFYGWNSWSLLKSASFTNCTFGQGTYWGANSIYGRIARPYVNTVFTNCDFNAEGYILDISSLNGTIDLVNCRLNGVEITADNFSDLVDLTDLSSGGETLMAKVMVNGVLVFDEANQ